METRQRETGDAGRRASRLVLAGLVLFVLLLALAVLSYPGGSWADARATGFAPLRNYWCDLFRGVAVNGLPSGRSQVLVRAAFLVLAATLPPFWWLASRRLAGPRARVMVIGCGLASALGVAVFALITDDDYGRLHAVVTCATGGLGLVAAAVVLRADLPLFRPLTATRAWGLALVLTGAANIAVYVPLVLRGGDSATMPVVQKLATLAVLGWMWTITRASLDDAGHARDDR